MKKSRRTYNGVHLNKKSNTQDVVEQSLTIYLSLMKIDPYRITLLLSGYFSAYTQHEHEQYTFNIKKHLFVI